MLGTLPKAFSQAATALASALGPIDKALPNLWEVAAWEIEHLGSFHLGRRPWENAFVKNLTPIFVLLFK